MPTPAHGSILIAGGGTGGHLMPGLAVAHALRQATPDPILFVGTARGLESRLVPAAGFPLRLITIGGLKSGGRRRQLITLAQLPAAVWQSLRMLRQTQARVVFGIGGYASGPMLAAAKLARVPIVLLEVNAKTGLANRWAARWARAAAVNFPETARDFPRAREVAVTGIPVRPEFFLSCPPAPEPCPLILCFGGSQGAHAINEVVAAMAPHVPFRILHQTGPRDFDAIAARYAALGDRVRAVAFIDDMAAAMAEATLIVARSGASTLGEIAAARKPAILIPLPNSTDQHQLRNAQSLAAAGATLLLEQATLSPESLAAALTALLDDPARRTAMATALAAFAHPDAATALAQLILRHRRPS